MCENFLNFQLDEKAISFIQAEKMYYETVLIDDAELEKHLGRYCEKTLLCNFALNGCLLYLERLKYSLNFLYTLFNRNKVVQMIICSDYNDNVINTTY